MARTPRRFRATLLLDALWSGQSVVPDVLTTAFYSLRRALRDSPKNPRYVRTVHRVGYQFIAEVKARPGLTRDSARDRPSFPARDARHAAFVGRRVETALFDEMLAGASNVQLLLVHGPPGRARRRRTSGSSSQGVALGLRGGAATLPGYPRRARSRSRG